MPIPITPLKPEPGFVWITLLLFYGFGAWLFAKGIEINSIGTKAIGGFLVICGLYYSLEWVQAKQRDPNE
ncbi:MAG TPA: hypothetical protein VGJ04_07155 [Pirellulales bacterium]|jgi:hypothetical protein